MAADEALLMNPSRHQVPTVRMYQWQPHCISLGYHQSSEIIDLDRCREDGIEVVRRPSGGRAVLHAEELTYTVVIPRQSPYFDDNKVRQYERISQGLSIGLQMMGIPVEYIQRTTSRLPSPCSKHAPDCFSTLARHEIVLQGKKLVGSAQRLVAGGLLQHGSILLGDEYLSLAKYLKPMSHGLPENADQQKKSINVEEFFGKKISFLMVVESLRKGLEKVFSIGFKTVKLTIAEERLVDSLKKKAAIFSIGNPDS